MIWEITLQSYIKKVIITIVDSRASTGREKKKGKGEECSRKNL